MENTKNSQLCIIGSGVVGQATGKGFSSLGFKTIFVDINPKIIEQLKKERFQAYTPEEILNQNIVSDIYFLTVPTPTPANTKEVNLDYLKQACENLGELIKKNDAYQTVVVKSTVPPETTITIVKNTLEKISGKKAGQEFGLCMNPEYLREVSALDDFKKQWIIVIGEYDKKSGDILENIYKDFECPIYRISTTEAEMQKYIHNLYNACKISYFNEMRMACTQMGINADKIFPLVVKSAEAIFNPSYGTKNLGPFGGSCLPKDTQGLLTWAQKRNINMPLLESIIEVNEQLKKQSN